MFSARLIYGMGIAVSVFSVGIWLIILNAQRKAYPKNKSIYKSLLIMFSIASVISNIVPVWFYAYRLSHNSNPTNIFYAFVINVYIYQITTATMFYILYRY